MQMTGTYPDCTSWVVSRQGAKRDFDLSMAVQNQCSRLYFHISRTGLWITDQMEAAFAIGSGKEVFLCIECLHDEDTSLHGVRSNNSSGYSSLASTPDDIFQPPAGVTTISASTSSAPSRSGSSSENEEIRSKEELSKPPVTIPGNDTIVKVLSKHHRDLLLPTSDVFGLPPCAVKDHNRSRSYLKSLIEEYSEEHGKGFLLDHPVESISDLIDLLWYFLKFPVIFANPFPLTPKLSWYFFPFILSLSLKLAFFHSACSFVSSFRQVGYLALFHF